MSIETRESFYRRRLFTRWCADLIGDYFSDPETHYKITFADVSALIPLASELDCDALAFEILWKAGFAPDAETDGAEWVKTASKKGQRVETIDLKEWDADILLGIAAEKLGV